MRREGTLLDSHEVLDPSDEAEFAGYVDSGIWELEEWLGHEIRRRALLRLYFGLLDTDF